MRLYIASIIGLVLLSTLGCDRALTFDSNGVAHGTGEKVYSYKSGKTQLREEYVGGKLVRSSWFKPDGALIQETKWADGAGEGIYLREDGSIRMRMQYVKGIAEGTAKEYDEAGNVTKVIQYSNGKPVNDSQTLNQTWQ